VLSGGLRVDVEGEETVLDAGDAMYFDSSVPHRYRREGKVVCTALVVTAL
jgi:mannose-6-phosphate isomerase-like protein (cupin superfamily)